MPPGNLKAIGRLHLSGRVPPNCREDGDERVGRPEEVERKEKKIGRRNVALPSR